MWEAKFIQSAPEPHFQPTAYRPAVRSPINLTVLGDLYPLSDSAVEKAAKPAAKPAIRRPSRLFRRPHGECPHLRNSGGGERVEMVPRICNSSLGKCPRFHSGIEATLIIALLTRRDASGGSRLTSTFVIRPLFPFGSHRCKYANKSRSCCGVNSR